MQIRPTGSTQSRIMIVQDCPGYAEIGAQEPLQGSGGKEFNRMLSDAGIMRSECFITSVIRQQVSQFSTDTQIAMRKADVTPFHQPYYDKMVLQPFTSGAALLIKEIELVKPRVILALGNGALFALTGKWGIKSWRGSELVYESLDGHKCLIIPAYTPSYINSVWKDRAITIADLRRVRAAADRNFREPKAYNFLVRPGFSQTVKVLNELLAKVTAGPTTLSVDIETRGGHIACTGIAWSTLDAICIPHLVSGNNSYWLEAEEAFIVHLMYRLFTHPNAEVIGQNFLYDAQYFYRHFHFIPNLVRDTMIAQHSMFSNLPKGLDYLSSMYCEEHIYWKDESKNWDPKVGEDQLWTYNCKDCVITFEVDLMQQSAINKFVSDGWTKLRAAHDFQQKLFHAVLDTMNTGIRVNQSSKLSLASSLKEAIAVREQWLVNVVGHPLNIKSPKQMTDFFYRELAQRKVISRKTGNPTCDDAALEKIGSREPLLLPLLKVIAELRSLGVFVSTFLEAPLDIDDRMRCSFNIAGTTTYRFSSSENAFGSGMNLQNIPSGDEAQGFPNVRNLFLSDEGRTFFDIDLDSADLRIVVAESGCKEMQQMFADDLKPYVEVAKEYYRDPTITKHHPSYPMFKALCHATNYLGTPNGISGRIGLVVNEVERIQKWYYGKFPEIKVWQDRIIRDVDTKRFVENIFGYRLHFFDRIEGTIYNQAIAWIPQSTVGCLINRGYLNLYNNEKEIQVLLQVHDSLAGQFPTSMGNEALARITKCCSIPIPYSTPLIIPVGIKSSPISWGQCS